MSEQSDVEYIWEEEMKHIRVWFGIGCSCIAIISGIVLIMICVSILIGVM